MQYVMEFKVKLDDDSEQIARVKLADVMDFEDTFNVSGAVLNGASLRLGYMVWLAYRALSRHTPLPEFDVWRQTVAMIEPVDTENDADPLDQGATTT